MTDTLFVRVTHSAQATHAEGDLHADFGHRVPSTTDTIDDGVYAGWAFEQGGFRLFSDRYGMYPLFYSIDHRAEASFITVSNSILRLLAEGADPEPDHEARSAFLRFGFYLGDDTPFRHIKAVPPRAQAKPVGGRWEVSGAYPRTPPRAWTEEQAIEAFVEGLRGAIGRRPCEPEHALMPLTAGRDSRHIIFELARRNSAPRKTLTSNPYPALRDIESDVAASVARHVGVEHETVPRRLSLIEHDKVRNLRTDLLTDEGTWAEILRPRIKALAPRYAYDGIAGNGLGASKKTGTRHAELFRSGRLEELADLLVKSHEIPTPSIAPFVPSEHRSAYDRSGVIERTVGLLAECEGEANPVERWYGRSRTRREVVLCTTRIFGFVPVYYAPFLDHELFDNLASVPAEDLGGFGDIHTKTIERAYPDASGLAYGKPGAGARFTGRVTEMADSLFRLGVYAARHRPQRIGRVCAWTAGRLLDPKATGTMPRRFLQYMLQLEHLDSVADDPNRVRALMELAE